MVIAYVLKQPVPSEYVIVAVPAVRPVTSAVVDPVDAIDALAVLDHVPPGVKSLTDIEEPTQTEVAPPMLDGLVLTVTTIVAGMPATV
jgi:hypothetical protein